jgi:hypothetical protein
MESQAVETTMQNRWNQKKSKEYLEHQQVVNEKEKKLEEAKRRYNKFESATPSPSKKPKVTIFGNDIVISR